MTETLATHRCTLCLWTGTAILPYCPQCGHGLTPYRIEYE